MKIMVIGSSAHDEAMIAHVLRCHVDALHVAAAERVLLIDRDALGVPTEYLIKALQAEDCVPDLTDGGRRRNKSDRKRDRGERWR